MKNEPLKIKKRGDDGTRIITVRIREETLAALDKLHKKQTIPETNGSTEYSLTE